MSISFISKSLILSCAWFSNMNDTVSQSSSAFSVIVSSLPAHLRIFDSAKKFTPSETLRSQRYSSNASGRSRSAQSETCDESIACADERREGDARP